MLIAKNTWHAYRTHVNGSAHDDTRLPLWDDLELSLKLAWCAVSGAALCTTDVEQIYNVYKHVRCFDMQGKAIKDFKDLDELRKNGWRAAHRAARSSLTRSF